MGPAKRPKLEEQKYRCTTCDRERVSHLFPNWCPTQGCEHNINTCSECLRKHIAAQLDVVEQYDRIPCPECNHSLDEDDIWRYASKRDVRRYVAMKDQYECDNNPNYRHCIADGCDSGEVHVPATQDTQAPNNFVCRKCSAKACVSCDGPWHEGESCSEAQKRFDNFAHAREEARSADTIRRISRACPHCGTPIQKTGGCNHMYCEICMNEFDWDLAR